MRSRAALRRLLPVGLLVLILAGVVVGAASAYDHSRRDRLAPGIRLGGVDVGGMSVDEARRAVDQRAVAPRRRTVTVHAAGHDFTLPASTSRVTADVDEALSHAVAQSRKGWLGARVLDGLTGQHIDESISLRVHYAAGVVRPLIERVAAKVERKAVDAKVEAGAAGLKTTPSRSGRALDRADLSRQVAAALTSSRRPASIEARTTSVAPKVATDQLAKRYPAYIIVDRKAHQLRFFENLKLQHTYPIAVGKSGLETPAGLYDVQWKETNPKWRVPNSAWAGSLAGKTIQPGPDNPIKARWMAFDGAAGIHGIDPSEYSSIGHDASHGCVRMRIPDVIALYARSPVGTPVYIA
jgi:lipoprotein-anchoring transpeptidase ErfK/SrfK